MRIDTLNVNGFRGNEKSVYDEIDAEELYKLIDENGVDPLFLKSLNPLRED